MITSARIIQQADRDGVPAPTVERDYVLSHILTGIASQSGSGQLVFKGGTALRVCYFEDHRYSADLDFSVVGDLTVDVARDLVVSALKYTAERVGFPQLEFTAHDPVRISYRGPLGRERLIKLDIADNELVEETASLPIMRRYEDQVACSVTGYTLDEVAAEKLRCLIQRVQCRDLFDLHTLIVDHAIVVDEIWPAFERKTRHKNIDPGIFPARFEDRIDRFRRMWLAELTEHVPDEPPPFDAVERSVRRALRGRL